jgi:hypothetical protein
MKSEVIRELHALLHERLFGGGPWLAQCETPRRLSKVRRTWAGGAGFGRVGSFARLSVDGTEVILVQTALHQTHKRHPAPSRLGRLQAESRGH